MRELTTGEKISCWLGGTLVALLLLTGGVYVYGWHINTNWRDRQFDKLVEWQGRRIDRELERANGSAVKAVYNVVYSWEGVRRGDFRSLFGNYEFATTGTWLRIWTLRSFRSEDSALKEIRPLRGLHLREIGLRQTGVADLSALRGMPLSQACLSESAITSLEDLRGMPLTRLDIAKTGVRDLEPLRGMRLTHLAISGTQVHDLSPLKGMPLEYLDISRTAVRDLSPLKGMPLATLDVSKTGVRDLEPLRGMRLTCLNISGTQVHDLSPLRGMPLEYLDIDGTAVQDLSALSGMKSLREICFAGIQVDGFSGAEDITRLEALKKKRTEEGAGGGQTATTGVGGKALTPEAAAVK